MLGLNPASSAQLALNDRLLNGSSGLWALLGAWSVWTLTRGRPARYRRGQTLPGLPLTGSPALSSNPVGRPADRRLDPHRRVTGRYLRQFCAVRSRTTPTTILFDTRKT